MYKSFVQVLRTFVFLIFTTTKSFCFVRRITGCSPIYKKNHWNEGQRRHKCCGSKSQSVARKGTNEDHNWPSTTRSRIHSIRSYNLAGVVGSEGQNGVSIQFSDNDNLVAVTGETGSGKSLLFARVIELLCGGKASASLFAGEIGRGLAPTITDQAVVVEMTLLLKNEHLHFVKIYFEKIGLDSLSLTKRASSTGRLVIRRTVVLQAAEENRARLKSICQVNGQLVNLKILSDMLTPLLVIVDASTATSALAWNEPRLAILDTAVSPSCLAYVVESKEKYRNARLERERLESEIASQALPTSFVMDNENDMEMVTHWINEIDAFETRLMQFCQSLVVDEATHSDLGTLAMELKNTGWMDSSATSEDPFSSALYRRLKDIRNTLREVEDQIAAANNAVNTLTSITSRESVATALDRARGYLFDAAGRFSATNENKISEAAERSHELLNEMEEVLRKCERFLEDDERGLLRVLEKARECCPFTIDEFDAILADWGTLARKHGVSPFALPTCHMALKNERDGSVEARARLPKAKAMEDKALEEFSNACTHLSKERLQVANSLSRSVTNRLPALGMEQAEFCAQVQVGVRRCSDHSAYSVTSALGLDGVDFLLVHGKSSSGTNPNSVGKVHEVASSGEKARILLAIECSLPGAVGACCTSSVSISENASGAVNLTPIAVLYDEIDAHVGGHAAIAIAEMLGDQSKTSQVIAISHSPTVAAIADVHVVVQKLSRQNLSNIKPGVPVRLSPVSGAERREELARMASGDLAMKEAQAFADALIREGIKRRRRQSS